MNADEVEVPHHSSHRGHWLDHLVGIAAISISVVSLFVAVSHGRTMEKLVAANSWPNAVLDWEVGYSSASDGSKLSIMIRNAGVGPARIESVEIWKGSKPIRSPDELLRSIDDTKLIRLRTGDGKLAPTVVIRSSSILGEIVAARSSQTIFSIESQSSTLKARFIAHANQLKSRVCYCSVFNDCYIVETGRERGRPTSVLACPAPQTPFDDGFTEHVRGLLGDTSTESRPSLDVGKR